MLDHDVEEDEENMNMMLEKIMKSRHDSGEPEAKRKDRIWARCWRTQKKKKDQIQARCQRTRNKTKGSNEGMMLENWKQNEGIESRRDAGEPETKGRD